MNWDAIAAVGQMLGSVAVFVTPGYLALQIRQNARNQQATNRRKLKIQLQQPGFRAAWRSLTEWFEPDLRAFVNGMQKDGNLGNAAAVGADWRTIAAEEVAKMGAAVASHAPS